ncbi:hypothetical protein HEQ60_08130 [Haematospirillum sp. H1815]|uniref:hypothetical protein n=1 Tax=Haematospirillum sp. H1815 TaxID=2723108 RepID=UPI0014386FE1|nr:hypothetical protein [Haematospirillum sp. H1815]
MECNGTTYHSTFWVRDRLRQDILENLGWRFHRIWSTDWFHHRNRDIERLRLALENTRVISETGIQIKGVNYGSTISHDANYSSKTENRAHDKMR